MSLSPDLLAKAARRGAFVRVLVAGTQGSAPREAGAEMLVWPDGTEGTIGGGPLEWAAIETARRATLPRIERIALGPALGQCCGGAVTLVMERFDAQDVGAIPPGFHARRIDGPERMPPAADRALAAMRRQGMAAPALVDGWLIEAVAAAPMPVWIWGAGHVGRAIAGVLAPLPGFAIHWIDTDPARFPDDDPGTTRLMAQSPETLVPLAPRDAAHLVLTYSHALDLELCHRILLHGSRFLGLIGSATKRERFRRRLRLLGHQGDDIAHLICPIGEPALGKHPQAIAVGAVAALLKEQNAARTERAATKGRRAV